MGATPDYAPAQAVIFGAPMDYTVSFRPGTRFGPEKIRSISYVLEEYSPYLQKELCETIFFDAGDLQLPFGNPGKSLELIHQAALAIFKDEKFPIVLGGEHLITLPVVQAAYKHYNNLKVIQIDAHADLREDYENEEFSHATVIRKVAELIGGSNVFQLGIRSGTKEEFQYAQEYTNMYFDELIAPLQEVIAKCGQDPVYLTIDIDILDPAYAPGTGTPEPGGATAKELLQAMKELSSLNIIGFDVVEVSPPYDTAEITSAVAAKLVREALIGFIKKPKGT